MWGLEIEMFLRAKSSSQEPVQAPPAPAWASGTACPGPVSAARPEGTPSLLSGCPGCRATRDTQGPFCASLAPDCIRGEPSSRRPGPAATPVPAATRSPDLNGGGGGVDMANTRVAKPVTPQRMWSPSVSTHSHNKRRSKQAVQHTCKLSRGQLREPAPKRPRLKPVSPGPAKRKAVTLHLTHPCFLWSYAPINF